MRGRRTTAPSHLEAPPADAPAGARFGVPRALLGVRSHFSFHWGVASPAAWFARAEELGYRFLGIADDASLHGLPEIVRLAEKSPVRPVYGASFRLAGGSTVIVWAADAPGYGNLCRRVTEWLRLCAGRRLPEAGGVPMAEAKAARAFFADASLNAGLVFVVDDAEVWRVLLDAGAETYWRVGPTLAAPPRGVDPGRALFAPGPFMLAPGDFETHRLLRAVGGAATLDRIPDAGENRRSPFAMGGAGELLRTPAEYGELFAPYAEAIERADALAARLAGFTPCRDAMHPPPPGGESADGEPAPARLRRLAYEGATIRYGAVDGPVRERLDRELDLIGRKGFAEYFLVVHDIVSRLAGGDGRVRRGRSVTCGRGSGAASLVNYCLGVTNVDAIKHDLMFERFLNESRADPPDIDVDFAWDERDGVIDRVFDDYGNDRAGRVANHNRYDWRGAFRAAAKAHGFSDAEITRHLRESPDAHAAAPDPSAAAPGAGPVPVPDDRRTTRKLAVLGRSGPSAWNEAARLAGRLVGIPHGLSMHCGGVVISPGVLSRTVPTAVSRKGLPTIQWEKDGAEDMGLVKIDLLGNRSLAVIRDAVRSAAAAEGLPEDGVIPGDPADDPATRKLLERGDTFGVFYLESPSMRLLMAKARKGDFRHAVIHSSIIRPAANAFINEYLARLRGKEWAPPHESLAGLFDESYGIPVYQEDVVKMAMALSGCDYAKADGLRKCLGKRNAGERLRDAFPELADAARERGVSEPVIREFWRTLMSMTGYSFCKPHSASFARVSFEAAYLRAHHPAHFMAAVLANGGGYYSAQAYVSEAMRLGLAVLGPDVNASDARWRAEGARAIRVGLMAVSGLSVGAMAGIEGGRERGGPFAGLVDFARRVRLHSDDLRRLALVGALDSLAPGLNRPQTLWCAAELAREYAPRPGAGGAEASGSLFDRAPLGGGAGGNGAPRPPALPDYTLRRRREAEYSALGFIPGCHPMVLFEEDIRRGARDLARRERPALIGLADLARHVGRLVVVLAWPISAKVVETKHGDAMMFQSFEDHRALCEAVLFPDEYRRFHRLLATLQPLWVTGRVEEEFEVATLRVLSVRPVVSDRGVARPPRLLPQSRF